MTALLFGRSNDFFDRHQALCIACMMLIVFTIDFILEAVSK